MPIIVEDGTCVVGANSLVTEQELLDFFSDRGIYIPDNTTALLLNGNEYFTLLFKDVSGTAVCPNSYLLFPRSRIYNYSTLAYEATTIPSAAKVAVLFLCASLSYQPLPSEALMQQKVSSVAVEGFFTVAMGASIDESKLNWADHYLSKAIILMSPFMIDQSSQPGGNIHQLVR